MKVQFNTMFLQGQILWLSTVSVKGLKEGFHNQEKGTLKLAHT